MNTIENIGHDIGRVAMTLVVEDDDSRLGSLYGQLKGVFPEIRGSTVLPRDRGQSKMTLNIPVIPDETKRHAVISVLEGSKLNFNSQPLPS